MKLSFASLVGLDPLPIEEVIAWAADHDVDGLEVNTGPAFPVIGDNRYAGHLNLEAVLADGPEATLALFANRGVGLFALAPMINLLTRNTGLQRQRIAEMQRTLDASYRLHERDQPIAQLQFRSD